MYEKTAWLSGDLITQAKANNWETQFDQSVKYSEINRQTVIQGATSSTDGTANFITGSTSALTAFATASTGEPLILSFANGNSSLGGLNYDIQLTTDSSWTGLSTSNTNYLFFEASTAGAVTSSHTIIPPQYGYYFDTTQNSLVHFDGTAGSTSVTDNYGNSWTNFGTAMLSTAQIKFGTTSLTLPGSSGSYVETTDITSFGNDGWTLEGWVYMTSTGVDLINFISSVNFYGLWLGYNSASGCALLYLANSTTAWDIANASSGITTILKNTWTKWSLDYNSSTYTLRFNGVSDITVNSTVTINGVLGGIRHGLSGDYLAPFSGYIDEFRFTKGVRRYVDDYTPESSAFTGDVHFFDINKMKMYYGDPTSWTEKIRLFVGEAITSTTSVTSADTYALKAQNIITSAALSTNQIQTFSHKIGCRPKVKIRLVNLISEQGYAPGEEFAYIPNYSDGTNVRKYGLFLDDHNIKTFTETNPLAIQNKNTGAGTTITMADWAFKLYVSRPW